MIDGVPLSPSQTRERLAALGQQPKQPLGQNFLVDGNIVAKSVALARLAPGDAVVEVGPGLGTLTEALLEAQAEVWAVEFDARLASALRERLVAWMATDHCPRLHLCQADAVDLPLAGFDGQRPFKVVANLPYAIATPWMERVLAGPLPDVMVLMLQKECADRFTALPGTKKVGAISVFLGLAYDRLPGHKVSRQCFYPAPEVDSVLLHLRRKPIARQFSAPTRRLIRELFTQRRKQIGKLLRAQAAASPAIEAWLADLAKFNANPQTRPEAIPLEAWWALESVTGQDGQESFCEKGLP